MDDQDVKSQFVWTTEIMDVKEFLRNYRHKLPVVIRIREGAFHGAGQLMSCGMNEMLWVSGIHKQPKIIARDQRGRYWSIPLRNEFKFQRIATSTNTDASSPDLVGPSMSLGSILEDPGSRLGAKFIFEKNQPVPFVSELDVESSTQFGTLEYVSWYRAYSLLGNKMEKSSTYNILYELSPDVTLIPVHVPMKLSVAVGFRSSDPGVFDTWFDATKTKTELSRKQENFRIPENILLFNETGDGEYEYILP